MRKSKRNLYKNKELNDRIKKKNFEKIQIELETYKKELEKENLELKEFFNENNNLKCENNNIFFNFEKKKN